MTFSEDGKYSGKQLCIIVTDETIVGKIAAATSINIEINVFAKNYNNVPLANAKTDVTIQEVTEPGTEETE